jgi:polyisoprenoid-binding protein YceI
MKIASHFLLTILITLSCIFGANAQQYITKTGHAYFMSHTDAIDIDGNNHQVACIANTATGEVVFIVLIKAFEFTLATADKHFNETYMESDEFPKATFKGKILKMTAIDFSKDGEYLVTAEGMLTIHGQTIPVTKEGKLIVKNGTIGLESDFQVSIADFKIEVPRSVENRVAKTVDIHLDMVLNKKEG